MRWPHTGKKHHLSFFECLIKTFHSFKKWTQQMTFKIKNGKLILCKRTFFFYTIYKKNLSMNVTCFWWTEHVWVRDILIKKEVWNFLCMFILRFRTQIIVWTSKLPTIRTSLEMFWLKKDVLIFLTLFGSFDVRKIIWVQSNTNFWTLKFPNIEISEPLLLIKASLTQTCSSYQKQVIFKLEFYYILIV